MDLLNNVTVGKKGVLELPPVIITKDSVGNIVHSAPLSSRIDANEERNTNELNESFTHNNYTNSDTSPCLSCSTNIMYDKYHGDLHDMSEYDSGKNIYIKNSDKYMVNPNNIHSTYMDKNRLIETDVTRNWSKYNVNGDMDWGLHWPYPCDGYNGCRYPQPDPYNAIFVNFTKGITVVWGSADGVQNLSTYASSGDAYVLVPPTSTWLVDKNLNFFSGIVPPNQFDSLIMPFKYDNTLVKNILEQKNDTLVIPSVDMLDGLRVVDYPPTSAMSYMQPPYVKVPDPLDGTGVTIYSQPHDVLEGMSAGSIAGIGISSIIGFIFLIVLVYVVFIREFECSKPYCDPETSIEDEQKKSLFNWFRGSDKKSDPNRPGYERLV